MESLVCSLGVSFLQLGHVPPQSHCRCKIGTRLGRRTGAADDRSSVWLLFSAGATSDVELTATRPRAPLSFLVSIAGACSITSLPSRRHASFGAYVFSSTNGAGYAAVSRAPFTISSAGSACRCAISVL